MHAEAHDSSQKHIKRVFLTSGRIIPRQFYGYIDCLIMAVGIVNEYESGLLDHGKVSGR